MPGGELKGKISIDASDLSKTEIAVKQFEENLKSAFRRTGDIRATTAIENFTQRLASGDVTGAIEGIVHRVTGLGVLGGAAFGIIAFGIDKAVQAGRELDKQLEAINISLSKQPTAGLGVQANIQTALDAAKQIGAAAEHHPLAEIGQRLSTLFKNILGSSEQLQAAYDKIDTTKIDTAAAASVQIAEAFRAAGEAATTLSYVAEATAKGNQTATTELEAQIAYDKEIAQISSDISQFWANYGDTVAQLPPELQKVVDKAIDLQKAQRTTAAGVTFAAKDEKAEFDKKIREEELKNSAEINSIKVQGLAADIEKNALAAVNVQHLQRQLDLEKDKDKSVRDQTKAKIEAIEAERLGGQIRSAEEGLKPLVEASKVSFEDLLAADPHRGSIKMIEGHQAALRAQREQELGERLAKGGFAEQAFIHLSRAAEIKAGIPILKEAEKNEYAFKAAIDSAAVFQVMVDYLSTIADAASDSTNAFLNK